MFRPPSLSESIDGILRRSGNVKVASAPLSQGSLLHELASRLREMPENEPTYADLSRVKEALYGNQDR